MAYAKLVFPVGTFALRKLKEIARFATGQISSVSDLQFADQSLSQIVITDAPGWSLEAQSFESAGTATESQYRLKALCVNNSKYKNVILDTGTIRTATPGNYTSFVTNSRPSSTATSGTAWLRLGYSWTGTTLNDSTVRVNRVQGTGNSSVDTTNFPSVSLSETTIYVFCSARKIIMFSPETSGRSDYAAVLEFPETQHTLKHANIPGLAINSKYNSADGAQFPLSTLTGDADIQAQLDGGTNNFNYFMYFTNWYSPPLGTRTNRAIWDYGVNNVEFFSTPSLNITSAGQTAYPLIPMTDIRTVYGEGVHNYSTLTDMYITYRESSYIGQGDTIDVNGTDYVIMQVGDATTNYRAFAIKKG